MSNYEKCLTEMKRIMRVNNVNENIRENILIALRENWKKEYKERNDSKPHESEPEPYLRFEKWNIWVKDNISSDLWDKVDTGLKIDLYDLFG